jgi:Fic family protein
MLEALYSLEAYFHTSAIYPPLIRTGLIHYQFEAIHPFLDGNGRLGRLLVTLLLHYWDLLPFPVLYLSAYFEQHRQEYYDRLLEVSQRGAWQEWLGFYLEGVVQQAEDAAKRARQIRDIQQRWLDGIHSLNGMEPIDEIIGVLLAQPWVVADDVARQLGMSRQRAVESLDILADQAILRRINSWHGEQRYLAEELWSIVQ